MSLTESSFSRSQSVNLENGMSNTRVAYPGSAIPISMGMSPRRSTNSERYNPKPTKKMIKQFWAKAKKTQGSSSKCYLDGRYFYHVLRPYEGAVMKPMSIMVKEKDTVSENRIKYSSYIRFDEKALKRTSGDVRLLKVIIQIGDPKSYEGVETHTNLLIFDTRHKTIYRFEPIKDSKYNEVIEETLKDYFSDRIPHYKFFTLDEHPQAKISNMCPGRGMCSAYVLMKAMALLSGYDSPFPDDHDEAESQIMRFAHAIESQYGILPGDPVFEYGFKDAWKEFKIGAKKAAGKAKAAYSRQKERTQAAIAASKDVKERQKSELEKQKQEKAYEKAKQLIREKEFEQFVKMREGVATP